MHGLSYLIRLRLPNDTANRQIVRRQLYLDPVPRRQAGKGQTRSTGDEPQQPVSISQFHPIHVPRQNFNYDTFNFDGTFSGHVKTSA